MPNWCENELTITGPDVYRVLKAICSQNEPQPSPLDFNRIIPYPQVYRDLDVRAAAYQEKLLAIARDDPERRQKLAALGLEYGVEPGAPWIQDGYNAGGHAWCCENWATKWNAAQVRLTTRVDPSQPLHRTAKCLHCQTVHKTDNLMVLTCRQCGSPLPDAEPLQAFLEFDTAWSPPLPVIEKLAALFPDHAFDLKYFEGGIGFCGHARWAAGREEFHQQSDYDGPRGG